LRRFLLLLSAFLLSLPLSSSAATALSHLDPASEAYLSIISDAGRAGVSPEDPALQQAYREAVVVGQQEQELSAAFQRFAAMADRVPGAGYNVAIMRMQGAGVERDLGTGVAKLQALATGGFLQAQTLLGNLLVDGMYVVRNPAEGRYWLDRAAQRNPWAAVRLGQLLEAGIGGEVDVYAALRLYDRVGRMREADGDARTAADNAAQRVRSRLPSPNVGG
jgi:TPR repeat protein